MPKTFLDFFDADKWARTNARDHCLAHHFWRIERLDNAREFAVAVRSRNTGALHHYASEA